MFLSKTGGKEKAVKEIEAVTYNGVVVEGSILSIGFTIHYSNGEPIPCGVLSESIKGVNSLMRESNQALFSLLGLDAGEKIAILVATLTQGSKEHNFVFRCLLGSDAEANATADKIHKRLGLNKMLESKHFQNVVITAIIAYGIYCTAKLYMPEEKAAPVIKATNSIIVNAGRNLKLSGDQMFEVLKDGVQNKRKAAKSAVQALLPAQMKSGTEVRIGGENGVLIPQAVLASLPDPQDINTTELPKTLDIDGVEVTFLASDSQKSTSGWAIKLPPGYAYSGKRIKAELSEEIRPSELMYKERLTVDLTVFRDPSKKLKPSRVLIRAIHKEN